MGGMAYADEVMTKRVHQVKKPGRAIGIPPRRCKSIEMGNFRGIHRRYRALRMKLIIPEIPGHALKEETEVALRGTTNHCQRVGILHQLGGVDIIDEIWITEQACLACQR